MIKSASVMQLFAAISADVLTNIALFQLTDKAWLSIIAGVWAYYFVWCALQFMRNVLEER